MSGLRALIVGGGIGGPVLAISLKRIGITPILFESIPDLESTGVGGAGLMIAPNGMRVLASIGLDSVISQIGYPHDKVVMRRDGGRIVSQVSSAEKLLQTTGFVPTGAHRPTLHRTLLEAAITEGVDVRLGKTLVDLVDDGSTGPVKAIFKDGSSEEGDFLVGCDGINSRTRVLLFGEQNPHYTNLSCTIGITNASALPESFIMERTSVLLTFGPKGRFGSYPVDRKGNIIWFASFNDPHPNTESWKRNDEESIRKEKDSTKDLLRGWELPSILEIVECSSFLVRLGIFDRPPLKTWHKGRVTLLGDAAHPSSPHLGQGASMAFEDAGILSRCLSRYPDDISKAFAKYERLRIPRTSTMVKAAEQTGVLMTLSNPVLMFLRDTMFRVMPPWMALSSMQKAHGYRFDEVEV